MNNKKYLWTLLVVLLFTLIGWRIYGSYAKANASTVKPGKAITTVEVKKAVIGPIAASINTTGTIQGIQEATIAAKTSGRIQYLGVSDGTFVAAGQTLVELDAAEIRAQMDQALANRDNAQLNVDRLHNLFTEDVVAKQQLDNANAQYYVYDAQVAQASASINLVQAQLANTVLTAPFSGTIFNKRAVLGDMASANLPLMTLVDTSKVKVEINVGENDIAKLAVGQTANFKVDAYPDQTFTGTVSEISPAADLKNRTFKAWILCDNPDQKLRSGMFARINLPYKQIDQAVKVPKDALVIRDQKAYVFIIEDGTAKLTPIVTGLESDTEIEITSGLLPETIVSILGHETINDNDKVAVGKRGGDK
ncbi:efflux RND transporter periplasmic adaptor subunit [Pelosinus sp. IPA-1]|uniref:efflux RND transporter periplasmic adaptor subunit n=1 Tax=Pelosinus sp. IPA-1 TaxID=3029569 RepID=UPI0024361B5D|nr:efflux RND transporter periplasmic adaptor subunit [Pelosinus sp. IPA-1]GMB00976.1 MexH family multidrug efflux RND transporter periplasmic adaptor subunit [Pelosinus sp. IPA-1]